MIAENAFASLTQSFPALGSLDGKVLEIARDELNPDETVRQAEAVTIKGVPGCLVLTDRRVIAFWKMKLFFFFSFPTVQEFHLAQIRQIGGEGATLALRAEAEPGNEDAGWEENTFVFSSPRARGGFASALE